MPTLIYDIVIGFSLPVVLFSMQLIQLAPQVFSGRHTDTFLRFPGAKWIIRAALAIERIGLTKPAHAFVEAISSNNAFCNGSNSSNSRGDNIPLGLDYSEAGKPLDASTREEDDCEFVNGDDVVHFDLQK